MNPWLIIFSLFFISPHAHSQFNDLKFKQALKLKKDFFISDGVITGGDRTSADFTVSNIRISTHPTGYDRVVIDLAGNQLGGQSLLNRPPFYMVGLDENGKRVTVTLYGKPKLDFSILSANQSAKKGKIIEEFEFTPLANQDRWTWSIHNRQMAKMEVFELTDPARIIIDLKK